MVAEAEEEPQGLSYRLYETIIRAEGALVDQEEAESAVAEGEEDAETESNHALSHGRDVALHPKVVTVHDEKYEVDGR